MEKLFKYWKIERVPLDVGFHEIDSYNDVIKSEERMRNSCIPETFQ